MPKFDTNDMLFQAKLIFLTISNVLCGFLGLMYVNVPMFVSLRRMNTIFVYFYDILLLKKPI